MKEYYKLLWLPETATKEEVKKAYRILAKRFHPDMPNGNVDKYLKIKEAYEAITKGIQPTVVQPRRDLTPFVLIISTHIDRNGDCIVMMNLRNIHMIMLDGHWSLNYRWSVERTSNGHIVIDSEALIKSNYNFNLIFAPYEGNFIFKNVSLKDPRGLIEKIGYKVKKFFDL
jgi:hypothetical protein